MSIKKKGFILVHRIGKRTIWYLCDVQMYNHEDCEWVLGSSCIQLKSKAKVFKNKEKAEKIAEILNNQYDEYGASSSYKIEEE